MVDYPISPTLELKRQWSAHLTKKELLRVLFDLGLDPSQQEIDDLFNELDQNEDGLIRLNEVLSTIEKEIQEQDEEQDLRDLFELCDKNKDGKISASAIQSVLKSMGEIIALEKIEIFLSRVDSDKDGQISFTEFVKLVHFL